MRFIIHRVLRLPNCMYSIFSPGYFVFYNNCDITFLTVFSLPPSPPPPTDQLSLWEEKQTHDFR